ncbi:MAG: helix-turn-helix domain-containing protein [Blastochloris viridis]|uniref:Helix-turn-helix domain-containing protein n=1 Tax=Blastochloris viridis TaxID=1079 RepID=A0A6N4R1A1_BLAVI|nr:MAG: helix-turn-helix domain-containing protein [Blastochloris viridis]
MVSLLTLAKAQEILAKRLRGHRVAQGLTQAGLAKRSGVSLATLRKFEQQGVISLESYLKLALALGLLDKVAEAVAPAPPAYKSIEEVLDVTEKPKRIRKTGWRS